MNNLICQHQLHLKNDCIKLYEQLEKANKLNIYLNEQFKRRHNNRTDQLIYVYIKSEINSEDNENPACASGKRHYHKAKTHKPKQTTWHEHKSKQKIFSLQNTQIRNGKHVTMPAKQSL